MALIGLVVSMKMFENNDHILVFSTTAGADTPGAIFLFTFEFNLKV